MERRHFQLPIALTVTLLTICPLAVVAAISAWTFTSTVNSIIHQNIVHLSAAATEKLSSDINSDLGKYYQKIKNLVSQIELFHTKEEVSFLIDFLATDLRPGFSLYYGTATSRYEEGGFYVDSSGWIPPETWLPPERPWYQVALATPGNIAITEPYIDADTGNICVSISHTATNQEGALLGVVAADLLLNDLASLVANYKISPNGHCYLVNAEGVYLGHQDKSKFMTANFFQEFNLDKSLFLKSGDISWGGGVVS